MPSVFLWLASFFFASLLFAIASFVFPFRLEWRAEPTRTGVLSIAQSNWQVRADRGAIFINESFGTWTFNDEGSRHEGMLMIDRSVKMEDHGKRWKFLLLDSENPGSMDNIFSRLYEYTESISASYRGIFGSVVTSGQRTVRVDLFAVVTVTLAPYLSFLVLQRIKRGKKSLRFEEDGDKKMRSIEFEKK